MRLETWLAESCRRFPDKVALVTPQARLTYAALEQMTDRIAAGLQRRAGVGSGERVLVFMDNGAAAAVSILAVARAGGVFVPVNPSTKADKLAFLIDDCAATAILCEARLMPVVTAARSGAGTAPYVVVSAPRAAGGVPAGADARFEDWLEEAAAPLPHGGIDIDLAMLIYTSGSTGRPKGVMMTHRNIDAAALAITTYLDSRPDDVILNVLPLAFDYGLYQLLMAVRLGATLVLERGFAFPAAIFDTIRREGVTGFPLVPTMAATILAMTDLRPGFLPGLRYLTNTAAALPVPHIARLRQLFPDAALYSMYGLTECKRCTFLPPAVPSAPAAAFGADWLHLDAEAEIARITGFLRAALAGPLKKRGLVLGLSGGIDSSVSAALAVRAVGAENVLALLMPEADSDPESLELGLLLADRFAIPCLIEDIQPALAALGCYSRRDAVIRAVEPGFGPGWGVKVAISNALAGGYGITHLVVEDPAGNQRRHRMSGDQYRALIAATNMKQRTRKQIEYHHADRLNHAVIGTPNRLEYDQGFFVRNGDGAADLKPIAHLYKSQVYQLAEVLGIPEPIRRRLPTTDTWSLAQTQDEFYFALPWDRMDLCLLALNLGLPAEAVAAATGLTPQDVLLVWRDIARKRKATRALHLPALLVEEVAHG